MYVELDVRSSMEGWGGVVMAWFSEGDLCGGLEGPKGGMWGRLFGGVVRGGDVGKEGVDVYLSY